MVSPNPNPNPLNPISLYLILEDPNGIDRARFLGGKDLDLPDLQKKLKGLFENLNLQEELFTEKEMKLEVLVKKITTLQSQQIIFKQDNGSKAVQANEEIRKLKTILRQLLTTASELAMEQHLATTLSNELSKLKLEMDSIQARLKLGLSPSEKIEQEFIRDEQLTLRKKMEKDALKQATTGPMGETIV